MLQHLQQIQVRKVMFEVEVISRMAEKVMVRERKKERMKIVKRPVLHLEVTVV